MMDIKRLDFVANYTYKVNANTYYPIYSYDKYDKISGMYTNLVITKTAQEVYAEIQAKIQEYNTTTTTTTKKTVDALTKENAQLWDTVSYLLIAGNYIN